jgi:hypothetical protein
MPLASDLSICVYIFSKFKKKLKFLDDVSEINNRLGCLNRICSQTCSLEITAGKNKEELRRKSTKKQEQLRCAVNCP